MSSIPGGLQSQGIHPILDVDVELAGMAFSGSWIKPDSSYVEWCSSAYFSLSSHLLLSLGSTALYFLAVSLQSKLGSDLILSPGRFRPFSFAFLVIASMANAGQPMLIAAVAAEVEGAQAKRWPPGTG